MQDITIKIAVILITSLATGAITSATVIAAIKVHIEYLKSAVDKQSIYHQELDKKLDAHAIRLTRIEAKQEAA